MEDKELEKALFNGKFIKIIMNQGFIALLSNSKKK
jgi:hypothetical protein